MRFFVFVSVLLVAVGFSALPVVRCNVIDHDTFGGGREQVNVIRGFEHNFVIKGPKFKDISVNSRKEHRCDSDNIALRNAKVIIRRETGQSWFRISLNLLGVDM